MPHLFKKTLTLIGGIAVHYIMVQVYNKQLIILFGYFYLEIKKKTIMT